MLLRACACVCVCACIPARLHGQRSASFADDTCTWAWGAVVPVGSTATDGHQCQLVRLWTMLLLGDPSLAWLGDRALVGGRATCSSAANHRTCRLLDQQHRPAAACQILYGLACCTDEHAVQQLLPVQYGQPGLGGRYLSYHSRCITALRTGQMLLSALAQG